MGRGAALAAADAGPRARAVDVSDTTLHAAFLCPITQEAMRDPVVTADGQTYEREAIERWILNQQRRGLPNTSPLTGEPLESTHLVPNVLLRGLIRELLETGELL